MRGEQLSPASVPVTRAAYITPPRCRATVPDMSADYRPLITNLHHSVHDDLRSAIELLEQGRDTAAVADLRAVEQRLAGLAHR